MNLLPSQGCEDQWKRMWNIFCLLNGILVISVKKKSNNNVAIKRCFFLCQSLEEKRKLKTQVRFAVENHPITGFKVNSL